MSNNNATQFDLHNMKKMSFLEMVRIAQEVYMIDSQMVPCRWTTNERSYKQRNARMQKMTGNSKQMSKRLEKPWKISMYKKGCCR